VWGGGGVFCLDLLVGKGKVMCVFFFFFWGGWGFW